MCTRRTTAIATLGFAWVTSLACTSEFDAPTDFGSGATDPADSGQMSGGSDSDGLALNCEAVPNGAISATFAWGPAIVSGIGPFTFEATGVPSGLAVDVGTGVLSGVPQEVGSFDVAFSASDATGTSVETICTIVVAPKLAVDLDGGGGRRCIRADAALLDLIVAGTGDGTSITCDLPGGPGNGKLAPGLSINPQTCGIVGEHEPTDRHGTWVWIVRARQSGAELYVPYCATRQQTASDFYTIGIDRSDLAVPPTQAALEPLVGRFGPAQNVAFGGSDSPSFHVTDTEACGDQCRHYGFAFGITGSPFAEILLTDDEPEVIGTPGIGVGLRHGVSAAGPPPDTTFGDRAWVANLAVTYCLAADDGVCTCTPGDPNCCGPGEDPATDGCETTTTRVLDNSRGNLEIGILMLPE